MFFNVFYSHIDVFYNYGFIVMSALNRNSCRSPSHLFFLLLLVVFDCMPMYYALLLVFVTSCVCQLKHYLLTYLLTVGSDVWYSADRSGVRWLTLERSNCCTTGT